MIETGTILLLLILLILGWLSGYRDMYGFVFREKKSNGEPKWDPKNLVRWILGIAPED